jgi:hypothetical protein
VINWTGWLPSEWSEAQRTRCWYRWFDAAIPATRPSLDERYRYANDRDHVRW